jgi:hypothetical protein
MSKIMVGKKEGDTLIAHGEISQERLKSKKEPQKEFLFTKSLKKVMCICKFYKYIIITYDFLKFFVMGSFFRSSLFQTYVRHMIGGFIFARV